MNSKNQICINKLVYEYHDEVMCTIVINCLTHAARLWNSIFEQADQLNLWNVAATIGAITLPSVASCVHELFAFISPSCVNPSLKH